MMSMIYIDNIIWREKLIEWARGDLNPGPPPRKGGVLTRLDDGPIQLDY